MVCNNCINKKDCITYKNLRLKSKNFSINDCEDYKEREKCYKHKNPHGYVFIWCEVSNGIECNSTYLRSFQDILEDYYDNYNFCPYCGKKLEIK